MEKEIELSEIWKIIRQRLKMIMALTIVAVLVSGLVSFFIIKPKYEATATILVQSHNANPQMVYNDLMANQKLVKTYGEIIKSRQIAEDVIRTRNLDLTPDQLLSKVQVKAATDSLVTAITVTDNDPVQAVYLANGFAESFYQNINSIMKVDNVSILDKAKRESSISPVSPKPYLNMAIALVLGLMIGIGLAFLREFMDKTIKTEAQVEELLGIPVLGVIANFDEPLKKAKKIPNQAVGGAAREIQRDVRETNLPV